VLRAWTFCSLACLPFCNGPLAIAGDMAKSRDQDIQRHCKSRQPDPNEVDPVAVLVRQQPEFAKNDSTYRANFRKRIGTTKALSRGLHLVREDEKPTLPMSRNIRKPRASNRPLRGDRRGFTRKPNHDQFIPRLPVTPRDDLRVGDQLGLMENYEHLPKYHEHKFTADLPDDCSFEPYNYRCRGRGRERSRHGSICSDEGPLVRDIDCDRSPRDLPVSSRVELAGEHADGHSKNHPIQRDDSHSFKPSRTQRHKRRDSPRLRPSSGSAPQGSLFALPEGIEHPLRYLPYDPKTERSGSDQGTIERGNEDCSILSDVADFIHPDRAWLIAPTKTNSQPLKQEPSRFGTSSFRAKKEVEAARMADERLAPGINSDHGTRFESRSRQRPPSRGASKSLSAEDGHQWAREAEPSDRGRDSSKKRGRGGRNRGCNGQRGDGR
jgi:hypothetical protein